MLTGRTRTSARAWRRVGTLLLLDRGHSVTATAEAVGSYRRETARVGKRYLELGLQHALGDDPRPTPAPLVDSTQQARSWPCSVVRRLRAALAGRCLW